MPDASNMSIDHLEIYVENLDQAVVTWVDQYGFTDAKVESLRATGVLVDALYEAVERERTGRRGPLR